MRTALDNPWNPGILQGTMSRATAIILISQPVSLISVRVIRHWGGSAV